MPVLGRRPIPAALALMLLIRLSPVAAEEDPVNRDEYLVRAGGCFSCHTAGGGQKLAGGRALAAPFGTFYSPNITPDPDTGIGKWDKGDLVEPLRTGATPEQSRVKGAMRETIDDGLKYLSESVERCARLITGNDT